MLANQDIKVVIWAPMAEISNSLIQLRVQADSPVLDQCDARVTQIVSRCK